MPDLNMMCGDCPIIDYCNSYDDTPPCCQLRFENLKVSDFINVCDYLENRSLWDDDEEFEMVPEEDKYPYDPYYGD